MKLRTLVIVVLTPLIAIVAVIGLTSINHPIILKWVTGSAKHHGTNIPATIYANGEITDKVRIYYSDDPNSYLLSLTAYENPGRLRFLNINVKENWIGIPVSASTRDYDLIAGHLFQSETGSRFAPLEDDIKGFNFAPGLSAINDQIRFNLPPNDMGLDSVRIALP